MTGAGQGPSAQDVPEALETDVRVALSTIGTADEADKLARLLVSERVAACVNIIPRVRSVYRWEGRVQEEEEVLMVIKTTTARQAELEAILRNHHPYDVPELLFMPCSSGFDDYLLWVRESCGKEKT